jgi:hypothetical protein
MKYIITFLLSIAGSAFSVDLEHCEKLKKRNFKIMTKSEMIFHKTYLSFVDANEMSKKVFSQLLSSMNSHCSSNRHSFNRITLKSCKDGVTL